MEVWFATANDGKLQEFKNLLQDLPVDVHAGSEMSFFSSPPETGETFEDNARIKARALRSIKDQAWVVADDSGLVVDGLNGLPGVHSKRYAGENASSAENNAKLLKMMTLRSADNRKAYFTCTLVIYSPTGEEFVCEGHLQGTIAKVAKGQNGFGYDPVFIPENEERTLGEMAAGEKNAISHRARALAQFLETLKQHL